MTMIDGEHIITVSERSLCEGDPNDPSNCAIAREIKRQHPALEYIQVGYLTITATDRKKGVHYVWRTPLTVEDAQRRFDGGDRETPFPEFHLFLSEARSEPIAFNETKRQRQNERRAKIRSGEHVPVPYSEAQKAAKRLRRRHS